MFQQWAAIPANVKLSSLFQQRLLPERILKSQGKPKGKQQLLEFKQPSVDSKHAKQSRIDQSIEGDMDSSNNQVNDANEAATKIQATFRGHMARVQVEKHRQDAELSKELDKLNSDSPQRRANKSPVQKQHNQ